MKLENGWGDSTPAKINSDGSLSTTAVINHVMHYASHNGVAFTLPIADLSLTSASGESGILYIENTGDYDLHISSVFLSNDEVTRWRMYKNPTSGTLISGGSALTPVNLNFSSGVTLDATVLSGTDGSTVTDGTMSQVGKKQTGLADFEIQSAVVIGRGNSMAITAEPTADCTVDLVVSIYRTVDKHS